MSPQKPIDRALFMYIVCNLMGCKAGMPDRIAAVASFHSNAGLDGSPVKKKIFN